MVGLRPTTITQSLPFALITIIVVIAVISLIELITLFFQIPLMYLSFKAKNFFGKRAGNLLVWMSLILGQPLALMMYYHDFVLEHYGSELITTFGTM